MSCSERNTPKALGRWIIVKPTREHDLYTGNAAGIVIPDIVKRDTERNYSFGTVLSVGENVNDVKTGDGVCFSETIHWNNTTPVSGKTFMHEGETFIGIRESDVIARYED